MFDVMRKSWLWDILDRGLLEAMGREFIPDLKTCQDLAVFDHLKDFTGKRILEVGGGNARLLPLLARSGNVCLNLDRFNGGHGGPKGALAMEGVENRQGYLGDFDEALAPASFDAIYSVSVVEHVPARLLAAFFEDGMRLLAPGGLWLHAIDIYLEDEPDEANQQRCGHYLSWLSQGGLRPLGAVNTAPLHFTCDMVSNPDGVMYAWGRVAANLHGYRQRAQAVTLFLAGRKADDGPEAMS